MQYLNVQIQGLSGTPHPALMNIYNMQEVKKLRLHIKFLSGDFLTAERQALDNGTNPQFKLCLFQEETVEHVLTQCRAKSDTHDRLLPALLNTVIQVLCNTQHPATAAVPSKVSTGLYFSQQQQQQIE